MTRRLTLPHGLAGLQPDGTLWVVMPASVDAQCPRCGASYSLPLELQCANHHPIPLPPAGLLAAAAPCREKWCDGGDVLYPEWEGHPAPCPDCRIELVGECPTCVEGCDISTCCECGEDYTGPCPRHVAAGHVPSADPYDDGSECDSCCQRCHGAWRTTTLGYAYAASGVLPIVGPGFDGPEPNGPYIDLRVVHPHMDGRHQWDAHVYAPTPDGGRKMAPGSLIHALAHYGDPTSLVGQYALKLRKVAA